MWRFLVLVGAVALQCHGQDLIVELPNGKVQGTTLDTLSGGKIYTWRHIPYAKPPVGELRFKPPHKPDPWTGVLDGSKDSMACLFVGYYETDPIPTYGYSEDCLYVNVYSPAPPNSSLNLPVMFWIYGGGFMAGTADFAFYDPTPIVQEDVIVVSFNYRLGIFGFLSTEDEVLPGNAGLKDQLAALLWTRENIAHFGGNPSDITIFGESAGGMSVGYHLVSPKSRGLYTGAILESGTCLLNFMQTNSRNNAATFAGMVDTSISQTSSSEQILQALQAANADLLVNISLALGNYFKPVFEVENDSAFLTRRELFYESIEAGNFTQVPIIIGTNSAEELNSFKDLATANLMATYYDSNNSLLLPNIKFKDNVSLETVGREIKQAYVGNGTFAESEGALVNFLSDNKFGRPATKHALLQSKYTPVYFYQFSFVGTCSQFHPTIPGCGRVAHAEEIPYLFNFSTKLLETDADFLTRRRFVKLWTNFAKTKNPTPSDSPSDLLGNLKWEAFDNETLKYLDIDDDLKLKSNLKGNLPAFWNHLWKNYSYRPYITF